MFTTYNDSNHTDKLAYKNLHNYIKTHHSSFIFTQKQVKFYMKHDNKILSWLKNTDIPLSKISKKTGISRKSLYNWQQGYAPTTKSLVKLTEYYNSRTSIQNSDIKLNTDGTLDAEYIIDLQQKRINSLEASANSHAFSDQVWDTLDYDYTTKVQLYWHKPLELGRIIADVSNMEPMVKHTGYSSKELDDLFKIGKGFPIKEHPIDTIVYKESLAKLRSLSDNMKHLFTILKTVVGDYYLPINLWYIKKNKDLLPASIYCKVEWSTMLVDSKVKLMV